MNTMTTEDKIMAIVAKGGNQSEMKVEIRDVIDAEMIAFAKYAKNYKSSRKVESALSVWKRRKYMNFMVSSSGTIDSSHRRVIRTVDDTDNLCNYCSLHIAECPCKDPEFGEGSGGDNVIGCSEFIPASYSNNYPLMIVSDESKKVGAVIITTSSSAEGHTKA